MLRLTWRNLLARKVRLLMSTLAIVLGIGFLAGVMTFSSGLNATFDNIVEGSTPDAQVRPAGDVQGANAGVGTTALITPGRRREARGPARGRGRGRVGRRLRVLPPRQGRQAGRRPGCADPGLQLRTQREHPGRAGPPARPGRVAREAGRGHPRRVLRRAGRLLARRHGHHDHADRAAATDLHPRRHRRVQRWRHRRRDAGPAGHPGVAGHLPRRPGRLHQRLADRRRRRVPDGARRRREERSSPTASPRSPATR